MNLTMAVVVATVLYSAALVALVIHFRAKLLDWLQVTKQWLQQHAYAVAGVAAAAIGVWLLLVSRRSATSTVDQALELQAARMRLAKLQQEQARRKVEAAEELDETAADLEQQIAESKLRVAELATGSDLTGISDEALAELLSEGGW